MKHKFQILVVVDEDTEEVEYHFESFTGPIRLRDFCYWMSEAYSGIMDDWDGE